MNLGDFLAELEAQRARLDTAIAGLRPLIEAATPAPNRATAPKRDFPKRASKTGSARTVKAVKAPGWTRRKTDPAMIARIQQLASEGMKSGAIAGKVGCSTATAARYSAGVMRAAKDNGAKAAPVGDRTIDPKTKRPWV